MASPSMRSFLVALLAAVGLYFGWWWAAVPAALLVQLLAGRLSPFWPPFWGTLTAWAGWYAYQIAFHHGWGELWTVAALAGLPDWAGALFAGVPALLMALAAGLAAVGTAHLFAPNQASASRSS